MQILSRNIIKSLFSPTLIILFTLSFLLWLTQSLRFLEMVSTKGIDFLMVIEFTINLLPTFILIILPVATAISVVFYYHKLLCDNEIVVMQASGMSNLQITTPAAYYGIIITLVGYLLSFYISPFANRNFQDKKAFLQQEYAAMIIQEGIFTEPIKGLTVYIDKIINESLYKGILINDQRKNDNTTLIAHSARLVKTAEGSYLELLEGGRQIYKDKKLAILHFKNFPLDISHYVHSSKREWFEPEERNIIELFKTETLKPEIKGKINAEINNRLAWPALCFVVAILGSSMVIMGSYHRYGYLLRIVNTSILISCFIGAQVVINMFTARMPMLSFCSIILVITSIMIYLLFNLKSKKL